MVADIAAKIEPKEEYLVIITVINHTVKQESASIGLIARTTPSDVATPLPPLNLKNTVKMCPKIAVIPTIRTNSAGKSNFIAISVGRKPLKVSTSKTIVPYKGPRVLKTLAIPILPLPVFVISIPLNLPSRYPVGKLPKK